MSRLHLLIAALGVGVLGVGTLAACGDEPVGSQLAPVSASGDVIVVWPDSTLARQLADSPDGPTSIEFTLADGVAVPATTGTIAWTAGAGEANTDVVQALAAALGADGELDRDAAGAWMVGTSSDNTVGLLAGGYLGDSFTYTSAARWEQMMANPCDPSSTCPGPIGVPDASTAMAAAQRVLDALGFERDDVDVTTEVREDGMFVTVRSLMGGTPTQTEPDVELLVGSDGSILQAGGRTSIADQTRTVGLIDAETAVARVGRSISSGLMPSRPPILELPATTSLVPMPAATTPRSSVPGSGGPVAAPASMTDTVTGFGVGHELVWDVDGRRWIVPTFTVSTASNMLFTVFAIEADMVRIVDAPVGDRDHVDLSGRGAPELAPPESPAPAAPTPTLAAPPVATSTTSVSPPFDNALAPPLTTTIPGTTAVVPCAGTPPSDASVMTVPPALPGPVDGRTREEWGASAVSVISPLMVGLPTSDAVVVLEQACWTVRISSPGGPTTTITPDLRWDRIVLVDDGNGRVAAVVFE